MIRRLSSLFLLASLSACSSAGKIHSELRLMTYNMHHGEGLDQRIDLPRIAAIIDVQKPDLVALQEVDQSTRRSQGVDQASVLAAGAKLQGHFGKSIDFAGGGYGNAILSSLPCQAVSVHALPLSGEARSFLYSRVEVPEIGRAHWIATHLDSDWKSHAGRLKQLKAILDFAATLPSTEAVILMGDFNATPDAAEIRQMVNVGWIDATHGLAASFPADAPKERIDYIFIRPGAFTCRVLDASVIDERVASDHRPVFARIQLSR